MGRQGNAALAKLCRIERADLDAVEEGRNDLRCQLALPIGAPIGAPPSKGSPFNAARTLSAGNRPKVASIQSTLAFLPFAAAMSCFRTRSLPIIRNASEAAGARFGSPDMNSAMS
jgi:hypothetical protein